MSKNGSNYSFWESTESILDDALSYSKIPSNLADQIKICNSTYTCLLYTSPSPRDATLSRMPSSA